MTHDLGTLEAVELRKVWPNEAAQFTPWLADNISLLGNALGYDLEVRRQEAAVGRFSLDILAHDVGRDLSVVIENQLDGTNHDHLGKLITYAAGFEAGVVIWIAEKISEEHRQALDWLNQRTDTDTEFFGVVVELLRIDDSKPAPNFRLVAFPNEWLKTSVHGERRRGLTPKQERYRAFYEGLLDELREQHGFTRARKAQAQSWYSFSTGFADVLYGFSFRRGNQVCVEVYFDREKDWNEWAIDELQKSFQISDPEFQTSLTWEPLPERNASRIALYRPGSIDDDEEALDGLRNWATEYLLKFKEVFGPRLSELVKDSE
ncbi:MAG: DUF4268 domain-containing protein [Chloroflexi bacterium]|nr:DUF4268 domain-containing protein [Chloroflexota bacterium]